MLALDECEKAADDLARLEYAARAAKVKRDIQIRRARRAGASYPLIASRAGLSHRDQVKAICEGPEPAIEQRRRHA